MRNSKIVVIIAMSLVLLTGCGSNNRQDTTNRENQAQSTQNEQEPSKSQTNTPEYFDTTISQEVVSEHYLSLGTLDKEVRIEGDERDRDEVEILNGKLIFPKGAIQSVAVKESDGTERFVQAKEKEVRNLMQALESASCSGIITTTSDKNDEVILVYKTADTEYRTVYIEHAEKDYYLVRVKEDDWDEYEEIDEISDRKSDQDFDVVQIQSKAVSEIINNWIK